MLPTILAGRLLRPQKYLGMLLTWAAGSLLATGPWTQTLPAVETRVVDSGRNVIFITWDGVRRAEFLGEADTALAAGAPQSPVLPYFWRTLAPRGVIYGDPRQKQKMTIGNLAFLSLPAYQSIFSGTPRLYGNSERVSSPTFVERIRHDLHLPLAKVASFASWDSLPLAVESAAGATYTNAGRTPVLDLGDAAERALNAAQQADAPPWTDCRYDRYTWQQAMRHLDHHRPRFLYVALDDSDEWAHRQNYPQYLATLHSYDQWLAELVSKLATMGDYGKQTCLVVTTDHGRGQGEMWRTHDRANPSSGLILMYAGCPLADTPSPLLPPPAWATHLDIRPTIETLFGLKPTDCAFCGRSLATPVAPPASAEFVVSTADPAPAVAR